VFLLTTAFFAYDEVSVAMCVNGNVPPEQEGRMNYDKLEVGVPYNRTLPINAPALLGVKGIIYATGGHDEWLDTNGSVFYVEAKGRLEPRVTATPPEDATTGVYNTTIFIYSSPYWVLLPDGFIQKVMDWDPWGAVIIFNVISAMYMAVLSVVILAIMAIIADAIGRWKVYASWEGVRIHPRLAWLYRRLGGRSRFAKLAWLKEVSPTAWLRDIDWYRFDPLRPLVAGGLAGVVMIPFILKGSSFSGVLIAAPLAGLIAYLIGCSYRAEVILAGVVSEGLVMGAGLAIAISVPSGMKMMVLACFLGEVGAIFALLFVMFMIAAALLSYLAGYGLHRMRIRYWPDDALAVNSDL